MKLILENIGKIKKAEIDLEHQLTVFLGPNNTGKTYVSYCLYGLSDRFFFGKDLELVGDLIDISLNGLYEKGHIEIDFIKVFLPVRRKLREDYGNGFKDFLPRLFGNYESGKFDMSSVSLSFFDSDEIFTKYLKNNSLLDEVKLPFENGQSINFNKNANGIISLNLSSNFLLEADKEFGGDRTAITNFLKQYIMEVFFDTTIKDAFFIPAERIGISSFGKDLILNRFSQTNSHNKGEKFTPYSLPVFDAIANQFKITNTSTRNSKIYSLLAEEIEIEVLGGKLSVDAAGNIFYGYDDKNVLSILYSASTIKSLSSLVFYLRYFAQEGQSLFIDEPEINLHPDNQRKIAKILAKISNLGIKVFVSTHSDYIIREFNNLMMLGKDSDETERLMTEYGYKKDELLDYKKVGAYLFNVEGYPKQVDVTETGFAAETIDETINNQNKASNDIKWTLFDE